MFIDTFSGWPEAFPTKHDTTFIVTKKLLEDMLPRYWLPQMIGSDNEFVTQVSQRVPNILEID